MSGAMNVVEVGFFVEKSFLRNGPSYCHNCDLPKVIVLDVFICSFATMKVSKHCSFCVCIETLRLRPNSLYKLKW